MHIANKLRRRGRDSKLTLSKARVRLIGYWRPGGITVAAGRAARHCFAGGVALTDCVVAEQSYLYSASTYLRHGEAMTTHTMAPYPAPLVLAIAPGFLIGTAVHARCNHLSSMSVWQTFKATIAP